MKVLIYTHPPDYVMATLAARSIQAAGAEPILAIDAADPPLCIEGVRVIRTSFPRVGNLNGREFVLGNLRLMHELGAGDEWICKGDSDTWWNRLDWIHGHGDVTAVALSDPGSHPFYGLAYALRVDRIPAMIALGEQTLDAAARLPEDITTGELATACGGVHAWINLHPGTPLAAYNWETAEDPETLKRRYDVIVFQRMQGRRRRDVVAAMKLFS
jgi:hypothetical protein